jgi:hypothetical protein
MNLPNSSILLPFAECAVNYGYVPEDDDLETMIQLPGMQLDHTDSWNVHRSIVDKETGVKEQMPNNLYFNK